jgi:tRNA pseudouridine38-40 synthase
VAKTIHHVCDITVNVKRFLKLTIAYDGTDYVGWQVQPNGITIQQRLEEAWESATGEKLRITASGRTDSGVHARGQVCSVGTNSKLSCRDLVRALNALAPEDIAVLSVEPAPAGFHAIRDAVEKTYGYQIQHGNILDPLRRRECWFVPGNLDIDAMREAAKHLTGQHDFTSFQSLGAERLSAVRNVCRLDVEPHEHSLRPELTIWIAADGFLYNMVRRIVGTLVRVGQGRKSPAWVQRVLEQKDGSLSGQTAPAHGLFLDHVRYPDFSQDPAVVAEYENQ